MLLIKVQVWGPNRKENSQMVESQVYNLKYRNVQEKFIRKFRKLLSFGENMENISTYFYFFYIYQNCINKQ